MKTQVTGYAVRIRGRWEHTYINAASPGKAKLQFLLDLDGCFPDLRFTDLRVRKLKAPHTSLSFIRNARYRGLEDLKCGQKVRVGEAFGTVVGHNASANFDVLFDEKSPKYPGQRLSVHPAELQVINE